MMEYIRRFFTAPVFPEDEDKTRRARLLHIVLVAQTYVLLLALIGTIISMFASDIHRGFELVVMVVGLSAIVLWRFLMRHGWVNAASGGMLFFFLLSISMILYSGGTIRSAGVVYYPALVVMATLLISRRAGIVAFILTSIVGIALVQGEISGRLPTPQNEISFASTTIIVSGLGLILVLLYLATKSTDDALKQARDKEREVREFASTLEQRVADRTKALATSTEVSRRLSNILNQRELVIEVVEQVKEAFGYYHAHIYLYDEEKTDLLMAGGTGDAGAAMLANRHKVTKGRGLVGRAAENNQPVLVPDTTQDPDWLPNPLLPETKSEVAIPISVGDQVLGVLDVQHNISGGLGQDDVDSLQSIANQIAIAFQNIRQYEEAQNTATQLSEALDMAKLAYWEYDVARDRFLFNDHFYSIFHTTAEREGGYELSSAQYAERLVHPEDVPLVGTEIEKALASTDRHYSTQLEHRVIFADGGVGYISVKVHIERDSEGNIIRYYGANQDITERKRYEEFALQRAQQQEALNVISQKIQSAATIEEAMQVAARELGHALGKRQTVVALDPAAFTGN